MSCSLIVIYTGLDRPIMRYDDDDVDDEEEDDGGGGPGDFKTEENAPVSASLPLLKMPFHSSSK